MVYGSTLILRAVAAVVIAVSKRAPSQLQLLLLINYYLMLMYMYCTVQYRTRHAGVYKEFPKEGAVLNKRQPGTRGGAKECFSSKVLHTWLIFGNTRRGKNGR